MDDLIAHSSPMVGANTRAYGSKALSSIIAPVTKRYSTKHLQNDDNIITHIRADQVRTHARPGLIRHYALHAKRGFS